MPPSADVCITLHGRIRCFRRFMFLTLRFWPVSIFNTKYVPYSFGLFLLVFGFRRLRLSLSDFYLLLFTLSVIVIIYAPIFLSVILSLWISWCSFSSLQGFLFMKYSTFHLRQVLRLHLIAKFLLYSSCHTSSFYCTPLHVPFPQLPHHGQQSSLSLLLTSESSSA